MRKQKTLAREIRIEGFGLHKGKWSRVTIKPAKANTGIIFVKRGPEKNDVPIPAHIDYVVSSDYSTTLGKDGVEVATVEHLLAVLRLARVDNAKIEVEGDEIPILDGSGLPFLHALKEAGFVELEEGIKEIIVRERFFYEEEDKKIVIEPSETSHLYIEVSFNNPAIRYQSFSYRMDGLAAAGALAGARTFGFVDEIYFLRKKGLIKGGSLANAVVFDRNGVVMNKEGLRFSDEPVRHKVLDLIGDLSLLGMRMRGGVRAYKPGHSFNHRSLKEFLKSGYYEILSAE